LGFPGFETQSVFCFLKGRTSNFLRSSLLVLIQPCLGKIIFSFYIFDDMCVLKLVLGERLIFFLFVQYYGGSSVLNISFLLVGFYLFIIICRRRVVCILSLLRSSLVLFILGV
jgi:hypothetical protein